MDQEKNKEQLYRAAKLLGGTAAALGRLAAAIHLPRRQSQTLQICHQMCLNGRPILAPVLTSILMACRLNMNRM